MTATATMRQPAPEKSAGIGYRLVKTLLTQRIALLGVLIALVLIVMFTLDGAGMLSGSYDADYLSASLINAVGLAMLGLAQLLVIVSGRGGIDLSVGAMVSLCGIAFGSAYGTWGWGLLPSILLTVALGAVCGAFNGFLIAYIGFPALIATLATLYGFTSLALIVSGQRPISTPSIQEFFSAAQSVEIPLIGANIPDVPLGVFTFLIPTAIVVWALLSRATFGYRLFAIGTNDVAANWSGINVRTNRMTAYTLSGVISGLVAIVTVAQFASARPDAGTAGNGMALPAITIAVLGGVAITGGIGRVAGVLLATLLVVWLNAGILLTFPGNEGTQYQLLALGAMLLGAALLNNFARRRFGVVN